MLTKEHRIGHLSFAKPDEVREFPNGRLELLNFAGGTVGRMTLQPGWRWSTDVKPIAGTEWCEAPRFQYHISGRVAIVTQDGKMFEAGPGDITSLPSGHDGWVIGNESVMVIDWYGATDYARRRSRS